MLTITVPANELFDDKNQMFITTKEQVLRLEHSLVSLSKWESKWCKPFLTKEDKTNEETIDYVKCMTLTQNVDPNVYNSLSEQNMNEIKKYIDSPMTATTFSKQQESGNGSKGKQITSELIYSWMITLNIPFECQKWHINRLLTLIRVCNIENQPAKKMSKSETMAYNRALNKARREKLHTRG